MTADGGDQINLARASSDDVLRAWAPDGSQIAFVSDRDGNDEIYVMRSRGSAVRRLTDEPSGDRNPAWSPDGRWIAFTSGRDGNVERYGIAVDGSDVRNLTRDPAWDFVPDWTATR